MKKLLPTLSILLLFQISTLAQEYDLNTYKYRYQKYKGLITYHNLNSNGSNAFNSLTNDFNNQTSNSISLRNTLRKFEFLNLDNIQSDVQLNAENTFNLHQNSVNNPTQNESNKSLQDALSLNGQWTNRYYLKSSEIFRLRAYRINGYGSLQFNTYENEQNATNKWSSYIITDVSVTWGRGIGRLDNVDDAVLAIFILKDLKEKLAIDFTNDQIEQIAKGITHIRNRRYLDTRIGRIKQLSMLDSVIKNNGIDVQDNVTLLTTLYDNWQFAARESRKSGKRITNSLQLSNSIWTNYSRSTWTQLNIHGEGLHRSLYDINSSTSIFLTPNVKTELENYKQLNHTIERSYGYSAEYELSLFHTGDKSSTDTISFVPPSRNNDLNISARSTPRFRAFWGYIIQPNSRNTLTVRANASLGLNHFISQDNTLPTLDLLNMESQLSVNGSIYHWVSPQLAFFSSGSLSYTNNSTGLDLTSPEFYIRSNGINYRFNAGFTYQLF